MNSIKLVFPVQEFNKQLKNKYIILDKLLAESVTIAEIGSGIGYVRSMKLSISAIEDFKNELISFEPPTSGSNENFVKSFKKDMGNKAEDLNKQAQSFRSDTIRKIEKESILSMDNSWFLVKNDTFIAEYYNENSNVLMDKAGTK